MKILAADAIIQCPHGGKVDLTPAASDCLKANGIPLIVADRLVGCPIVGCTGVPPAVPPCTTVASVIMGKYDHLAQRGSSAVTEDFMGQTNMGLPLLLVSSGTSHLSLGPAPGVQGKAQEHSWIEIELLDEAGQPVPGELCRVECPDGKVREGYLNEKGRIRWKRVKPGDCEVTFPDLDKSAWETACD